MLFMRSIITPRPTEGNIEDPDVSNIFTADVNEFDKESIQFQEEADIYDSEFSYSLQLNASFNQSVAASQPSASGTNETCYKTQDTEVTVLQSNCRRNCNSFRIPFPMRLDELMQLKYHQLHPGNVNRSPPQVQ
jgi:hypothetical protein